MAFNNKKSSTLEVNGSIYSSTEKELNKQFDLLTYEFIDLQKIYEYLRQEITSIDEISNIEYRYKRKALYERLNTIPSNLKKLNIIISNCEEKIKDLKFKSANINNTNDFISNKVSSLNTTKKKILEIIDSTSSYEEILKKRDDKLLDLDPGLQNNSDFNNYDKNESLINGNNSLNKLQSQEVDNFRSSLLIVTEIKSNENIMNQRGKDLNEIHGVTNQLRDMTTNMKGEVKKQQGLLDNVEEKVNSAKINTFKADQQIKEADKDTKSMTCKILWLCLLIMLISGGAVGIYFAVKT